MILLFNHIPVSLPVKVALLLQKVKQKYGSDFYDVQGARWKGDQLTIESLFPEWIIREASVDSSNNVILVLIKNYLRWLMSAKYGYGANPEWSTIRDPIKMDDVFLEALAEYYFPNADFGSDPLINILPNIRKFAIKADDNYFVRKGTPEAIKYALITLFDLDPSTTSVVYTSIGIIKITSSLDSSYRDFVNNHIVPAGIIVSYS